MLERLDAVDWKKLKHAQGSAANVPQARDGLLVPRGEAHLERATRHEQEDDARRKVRDRREAGGSERVGAHLEVGAERSRHRVDATHGLQSSRHFAFQRMTQVVVAWASSLPSGPRSFASAVAVRLPAWTTLPSARTRPVAALTGRMNLISRLAVV